MRVVTLRRRVSLGSLCQEECCYFLRDVVRILCIFSFLSFLNTLFLYMRSCDHLQTYIVHFLLYIVDVCFFFTYPFMCFFFSLFIHMLLIIGMQSIISVSHKDALMSFVYKCFRNIGCQSLLAINSLFTKFFKSLCQDRGQILLYLTSEYKLSDL